jgi:hypothetical protein
LYSSASFTRIVKAKQNNSWRHKASQGDNRKSFSDGALTSDKSIVNI